MNYMNAHDRLCLLNGAPLRRGRIKIYPPTIDEIVEISYDAYNTMMVIFMTDTREFYKDSGLPIEVLSELTFLDLMLRQDSEFKDHAINVLNVYFKQEFTEDMFLESSGVLIQGQPLTSETWEDIRFLVMEMNDLKNTNEVEPVFTNAKAKEIWEKQRKAEEARNRAKNAGAQTFEDMLCEIISSVCSKSHTVTYSNVGDLNIYQLKDHLAKLIEIEAYNLNMMFAAHGAEIKDNKHWSEPSTDTTGGKQT